MIDRIGAGMVIGVLYGLPCYVLADMVRGLVRRCWP